MLKKLYVGNVPALAVEDDLRRLFETYGSVRSVALIMDQATGRPRGFGFVEMDAEAASTARSELDGHQFEGRTLRVDYAVKSRGANSDPYYATGW